MEIYLIIAEIIAKFAEPLARWANEKIRNLHKKKALNKVTEEPVVSQALNLSDAPTAIVAISIGLDTKITADVLRYVQRPEIGKAMGLEQNEEALRAMIDDSVFLPEAINFKDPQKREEALQKFDTQLKALNRDLKSRGVRQIHLFYGGPGMLATKIGSEFSNRYTVIGYQLDRQTHDYQCCGEIV